MKSSTKLMILVSINLFFSFTFLMIGAKSTPQWLEFQNLNRTTYLIVSITFLGLGVAFLWLPLKYMLKGIYRKETAQ